MNNTNFEKNSELIVYLDMDGVLVDFDKGFSKLSNGLQLTEYAKQVGTQQARNSYLDAGSQFWEELEWIHGGKDVWNTASGLFERVCILSSTGTSDPTKGQVVRDGKLKWLKTNIPVLSEAQIFIVPGKHKKQEFSNKHSILVDDIATTIQEWNSRGGYGILHQAERYKKTLEDLEDLATPIKIGDLAKRYKT